MSNKQIGSSMRSLFEELGEDTELELLTRKRVLADEVAASMERLHLSKKALAEAMSTSRTVVYRLLDPTDTGVTLETLVKASRALDIDLHVWFGRRAKGGKAVQVKLARSTPPRPTPTRSTRSKASRSGDLDRASAPIAVLKATPKTAAGVDLASRRRERP
jgi:antitoxin HicB